MDERRHPTKTRLLPPAQRKVWPELRGEGSLGYVLYGGTALALRLAHRRSVDFDFFMDQTLSRASSAQGFAIFGRCDVAAGYFRYGHCRRACRSIKSENLVLCRSSDRRIGLPQWTDDGVVQIASPIDLFATKLKFLLERVEAKDYQDIAAILEHGGHLAHGLAAARVLYGGTFQPTECLKALIYFKGGDLESLSRATRSRLIAAVNEVRALSRLRRTSRSLNAATARRPRG